MDIWHGHEAKIEKEIIDYFESKGYRVASHRASDLFDVIAAKIDNDSLCELIGIEIKSDKDNFTRLYEQLPNYLYVFDKVYLALENKKLVDNIPFPIGIIRVNGNVVIEREALNLNFKLSRFITKSAIKETIEKSDGIKNRANELLVYIEGIEKVKRKLLYNSLFYDNKVKLTNEEKTIVDFIINNKTKDFKKIGLFSYSIGEIEIGVDNGI